MSTNILLSKKPFYKIPDLSVGKYVWNRLQELSGDTDYMIEANSDSRLTLNQLISKSNGIAMALIDSGINKSNIIVTFADNSIEHTIVLFAAIFLGTTVYPISPIANLYELENLFKTLGSFVLIISQSKAELINKILINNKNEIKVKTFIVLDGIWDNQVTFDQLLKEGNNQLLAKIPYFSVDPEKDICILLQSSGTSGAPKSVMLSHRAFMATILDYKEMKCLENPLFAHMTPFGCISGVTILFSFIPHGIPVVIYKLLTEESILKSIEKYGINFMYFTPPFGHKLIDERVTNKFDLSSLKHLITGGSPFAGNVGKDLVHKYNVILLEGYGMTEFFPITDFSVTPDWEYFAGNLGKVSPNSEMKIIDTNSGQSLGPDLDGEICVRGPKMFSGYLNNKVATEEAIDKEGWLHSGDIGHYDKNNNLYIMDRLKELIKFHTIAVSPTEIEQLLLTHKCVAEVVVVGVKHSTDIQWPRAFVKVHSNMTVSEDELKRYVADNLNFAKQLRAGVIFVDNIPRTTIGKVNRRHFKTLVANEIIE